jgi:hypothetical protein
MDVWFAHIATNTLDVWFSHCAANNMYMWVAHFAASSIDVLVCKFRCKQHVSVCTFPEHILLSGYQQSEEMIDLPAEKQQPGHQRGHS